MRRMFVSRSSLEKPSPLLRFSRTSSPSRISTRLPSSFSFGVRKVASVLFPLPESPVNQRVSPLSLAFICRGGWGSADLAFEVGNLEALLVHDRAVPEVAELAEELAVVRGDDEVGVLRDQVVEFAEHRVEVAHGVDLAFPELIHLLLIEELEALLEVGVRRV